MTITEKAKRVYARWLFRRYGFTPGLFFEEIPVVLRLCPLFSPSCYWMEAGQDLARNFEAGFRDAMEELNRNANRKDVTP